MTEKVMCAPHFNQINKYNGAIADAISVIYANTGITSPESHFGLPLKLTNKMVTSTMPSVSCDAGTSANSIT